MMTDQIVQEPAHKNGGLIFPMRTSPAGLRWISNVVQARYYIVVVCDAFLQGAGWAGGVADSAHLPRMPRVVFQAS